jgi:AraC family ethanolamine operon transcriptional activator
VQLTGEACFFRIAAGSNNQYPLPANMSAYPTGEAPMVFPAGLIFDQVVKDSDHMRAMAAFWRLEQTQLDPGVYHGRLTAVHSPNVQLGVTFRARSTRLAGEVPAGTYVFAARRASPHATYLRGEITGSHDLPFVRAGEDFTFQPMGDSHVVSIAIPAAVIERYGRSLGHESPLDRNRNGILQMGLPVGVIADRLNMLLDLARYDPALLMEPAAAAHYEQKIFDLLLGSTQAPAEIRPVPTRRRIAREAEEYLRGHAERPLVLQELCQVLRTSARTLELGFHEVYGMSLKAYLQALRFNGARRDLIAGEPRTVSVKEVALRWGFLHLGRFAVNYRRWFGESPSTTLAR